MTIGNTDMTFHGPVSVDFVGGTEAAQAACAACETGLSGGTHASAVALLAGWTLWCGLIVSRICVRADFEMWYVKDYQLLGLILHQSSIIVGSVTLFMTASRLRFESLIKLSGASFFVYLVHEFPLRGVVDRLEGRFLEHSTACWIVTPLVVIVCFAAAMMLNRFLPSLIPIVTGGRTPTSATRLATTVSNHPVRTS